MQTTTEKTSKIQNLWDDKIAKPFNEQELLLYRSNLLGSDLRVTNYGGGNTSAKVTMKDPLTNKDTEVLWVKGSGGDLGSMKMDGLATLYMDKYLQTKSLYTGIEMEDKMVAYNAHCTFNLNSRAASIDTPLHAFIPYRHVDHMHPDAVIAIAAAKNSEKITQEIYDGDIGWVPWQRPGFDLGLKLEKLSTQNKGLKGIILAGHGVFTWGNTARECYDNTLDIIQKAADYIQQKQKENPFGGSLIKSMDSDKKENLLRVLLPILRGKLSKKNFKIGHVNESETVMEFVNSKEAKKLAEIGTCCPDHFLRTKISPLYIDFNPAIETEEEIIKGLDKNLENFCKDYNAYYDRCKHNDSPAIRDPYPVLILIPGVGMLGFAKDKSTARISTEFFINTINVMRGAGALSEYEGLPEQEAFNIEYWALEEAKLQRLPKPKSLAGKIAVVTGGAGGIGKATARKFLQEGACVVLADIDSSSLEKAEAELSSDFNKDLVYTVNMNVTKEPDVINALTEVIRNFSGLDILVSNAGIASASPIEETTLEIWNKNMDILSKGYFLVSREAFRIMGPQDIGGSLVFVASKNALAASPNTSAYSSAKASELHLARCLALEGAPRGIRVNVVNPDAVLRGSKIWTGNWKKERADAYHLKEDELEEHYRKRSLLKRNVFPEDIAEGIYFFASNLSAKSTGNILNVDAGNDKSFTR